MDDVAAYIREGYHRPAQSELILLAATGSNDLKVSLGIKEITIDSASTFHGVGFLELLERQYQKFGVVLVG